MQYPVPQFTDVEDRIIGPLTLIQFFVLFGAGLFLFVIYMGTKNLLITIVFFMIFGLPALAVAFGKSNGRALYKTVPYLINFMLSPKVLVFHKEAPYLDSSVKLTNAKLQAKDAQDSQPKASPKDRLKEVNRLLQQQAKAEEDLLKKS